MKRRSHTALPFAGGVLLWLFFLLMPSHAGDIGIKLEIENSPALEFESVYAVVSVRNEGRSPVIIDGGDSKNKADIVFSIKRMPETQIFKSDASRVVEELVVLPNEEMSVRIEVSRWYNIGDTGRYVIRAALNKDERQFESDAIVLDVVPGIELASVSRGVYGEPATERKYSLRYWQRKERERLFLRVDETGAGKSLGVINLGPLVRVTKPEIEVDRLGNVRVWHQCEPPCFARTQFKSDKNGIAFVKQTFHLKDGSPYPKDGAIPAKQ